MKGGKGEARSVTQQGQPHPETMAVPNCGVQGQVSPSSEGQLAGEGKERAQSCIKSTKAERAAHTQIAVNGTIYMSQGEMTKHHRFF